ncbi:unnamed protein product [Effrenium voratum]|nr:unnamed protein product [Effrenium voratum]
MERWTSADIVALSGNPTGWPLPTWVQKEIDIYPCRPGEAVVLDTAGNASTCKQCPVGQYRTPRSVECEDCHPGTYGSQPGMSRCNVCPSGAECPGNAEIFAQPGFYCLPSASQSGSFAECARELCLGGNQCKENHQGILCRSCEPGYSLPLWGLERDFCSKCPSDRVALGGMALTISLYVFYIWLIVKGTLSASQSVKAIHSVILKIGVNYLQFAGTAFEATEFKEMMLTIYGPSVSWLTPFVALPQRLQYPFTALMSLDCFFPAGSSIRPYQAGLLRRAASLAAAEMGPLDCNGSHSCATCNLGAEERRKAPPEGAQKLRPEHRCSRA